MKWQNFDAHPAIWSKNVAMLDLSVEALKILMYLQEVLLKEASKSKFLMSMCLRSKDFKLHVQV